MYIPGEGHPDRSQDECVLSLVGMEGSPTGAHMSSFLGMLSQCQAPATKQKDTRARGQPRGL